MDLIHGNKGKLGELLAVDYLIEFVMKQLLRWVYRLNGHLTSNFLKLSHSRYNIEKFPHESIPFSRLGVSKRFYIGSIGFGHNRDCSNVMKSPSISAEESTDKREKQKRPLLGNNRISSVIILDATS